jgi:hypothetical protein
MTKRFQILLFTLLFGLCLNSFLGYAIAAMPEKAVKMSCCKMQNTKTEKSCCQKNQKQEKSCGGKCSNSCTPTSLSFNSIVGNVFVFHIKAFDFYNKKPSFYYGKTFIKSGFSTIWLPPKIA